MPASKDQEAEALARRTELIRIRRLRPKVPFHDPEILALGYSSDSAARKDFYRALEQRRKFLDIEVTAYREEQNEIIESLLEVYLPLALGSEDTGCEETEGPSRGAAEMVLKLLERQAKLNGWEAALKAELSGPGGGAVPIGPVAIAELRALIRTAGEPDPENDDEEDPDDGDVDDDGDNES